MGSAHATTFTTLYTVTPSIDGAIPHAGLISAGGTYYGTTSIGGLHVYGTAFTADPTTGAETILYNFAGGNDGASPNAALLKVGNVLYGTTIQGGATTNGAGQGSGRVFSIDLTSRVETVLYRFAGGADGLSPQAELIDVDGVLYGTTTYEGTGNGGTVFSINPSTGLHTVLHTFAADADGGYPVAGLINAGGILYGTTPGDGVYTFGTVFSINPATGAETVIHASGGESHQGTVISINPATGAEHVLYSFMGASDGGYPSAALVNVGGTLYGTTADGGASRIGTAFELVL